MSAPPVSTIRRRRLVAALAAAALLVVLVVLVVVLVAGGGKGDGPTVGSTLDVTVRDPTGSGELTTGPGAPLRDRTDLLGPGGESGRPADSGSGGDGGTGADGSGSGDGTGSAADGGRPGSRSGGAGSDTTGSDGAGGDAPSDRPAGDGATGDAPAPAPGRVLATVAQLTDTHVRDTASPARVPFLDRLGAPFTPVFRPQEPLTLQTLAAATRTVNALAPGLTVVTGDLIDNDQQNELDAAITTLKGGRVRPFDARTLQGADNADPFFYRPDVDPPREPGLLTSARRTFTAPGLRSPVAVVPGNHDVLVGGEVQATPALRAVAVGARRLVTPDPEFARTIPRDAEAAQAAVNDLLAAGRLPGTTEAVRPDPSRRLLTGDETVRRLAAAGLACFAVNLGGGSGGITLL
ncbi:MAG: hypothetical protein Q7T67_00560, partial [Patulibacter sp.]|nr:hypothetical protein [Patulibacter sp.]